MPHQSVWGMYHDPDVDSSPDTGSADSLRRLPDISLTPIVTY